MQRSAKPKKTTLSVPCLVEIFDPQSIFSPYSSGELTGKHMLLDYAVHHNKNHLECSEGYENRTILNILLAPTPF